MKNSKPLFSVISHIFITLIFVSGHIKTVEAEKILGLGLSRSKAGIDFNQSVASANAKRFIIEQVNKSYFKYTKKGRNFKITRTLKATIGKIRNKEVIYLRRKGVAVIAQVDVDLPKNPNEVCFRNKVKIRRPIDLKKMFPQMLKRSVRRLAKSKYKNRKSFSGLLYIKKLRITKWRTKGRYTIRASVCMVNVK